MADLEQSAEQVFGEALELQPERRAAFLDQACRDAPELRRLVEELIRDNQLAGKYPGLGPYGTYDMTGNVREWVANAAGGDLRFIMGGSWKSQS
jgi:formylglycine-generating enzyme required for sulfatase activity